MNKITFSNTTLTCTFQKSDELLESQCLIGVFSKTPKGFRFEEALRKSRPPRNPKLSDGKFISMVTMQNGRHQGHLKTTDKRCHKHTGAEGVYQDSVNALKIID